MSVDIIIDRMTAKKLVPAPSPPPPGNAFITLRMASTTTDAGVGSRAGSPRAKPAHPNGTPTVE
jgi:hypothetical protein